MKKLGYALKSGVRTEFQTERQYLINAGCKRVFSDSYSQPLKGEFQGFENMLSHVKRNTIIVIRNFRSMAKSENHLRNNLLKIKASGADLLSLEDNIDTTSQGKDIVFEAFKVYFVLNENERMQNK